MSDINQIITYIKAAKTPFIFGYPNLKGGVAKTTSLINFASYLARQGLKVLIVDGDPDCCATEALIPYALMSTVRKTIADVFLDPAGGIEGAIYHYKGTPENPITFAGVFDILCGSRDVAFVPQTYNPNNKPVGRFSEVPQYVAQHYYQGYDVVLIDTSPSDDELTQSLYAAIQYAVIPTLVEPMSQRGVLNLFGVMQKMNQQRAELSVQGEYSEIVFLGLALCKVFQSAAQQKNAEKFAALLDTKKMPRFQTIISYSDAAAAAPGECLPLSSYAPEDPATAQYDLLSQEILGALYTHVK